MSRVLHRHFLLGMASSAKNALPKTCIFACVLHRHTCMCRRLFADTRGQTTPGMNGDLVEWMLA